MFRARHHIVYSWRRLQLVVARQYSIVKDLDRFSAICASQASLGSRGYLNSLVGLGRLELPTSPLSGVRSNHLSYRPLSAPGRAAETGGAGRDRTGDLLNANQALSQLSYSPAFLPRPIGRNDRKALPCDLKPKLQNSKWRSETRLSAHSQ